MRMMYYEGRFTDVVPRGGINILYKGGGGFGMEKKRVGLDQKYGFEITAKEDHD